MNEITVELLSTIAGIVLSLAASYLPGFDAWYAGLDGNRKRLVMLGLLAAASATVFGLSCAGWFSPLVTCDKPGVERLLSVFISAVIANQAAYAISPKRK